jgi:pyruvate kinase
MSATAIESPSADACEDLIRQVESLRQAVVEDSEPGYKLLSGLPVHRRNSAENLLHYLAMRSRDLRALQDRLADLGLSSFERAEPGVLANIDAVLRNLYLISGQQSPVDESPTKPEHLEVTEDLLAKNTAGLLGKSPRKRRAHIMVTLASEAAEDYLLVHQLLKDGMDCVRINCAHDSPETWIRTIGHVRDAERVTGRPCRILMDLAGPKLRTGPMESEPAVRKIRPVRTSHGQIVRPARIWLTPEDSPHSMDAADANFAIEAGWLARLEAGDGIKFRDARGSRRNWKIKETTKTGCWAEAKKTAYLSNGTVLRLRHSKDTPENETTIRTIPAKSSVIRLRKGDTLLMAGNETKGIAAIHDDNGELKSAGRVSLPIPEIYRDAHPGERVFFDDGRIGGIIGKINSQQLQIHITHTRNPVEKLSADKGVNFPDTHLNLPALSAKDINDLAFAARHSDMVGLSFANSPDDILALGEQLDKLNCKNLGVVIKVETNRGFTNLPAILLEALNFPDCGVMIARGDLGVECGFERMAEVQEEILWVCEAVHLPVIWATQVLEGLAKRGHTSRAEISDAAMGQAAECVMLNKGPYITEAVRTLDDILQRMQGHHRKKRSILRKLHLASAFYSNNSQGSTQH